MRRLCAIALLITGLLASGAGAAAPSGALRATDPSGDANGVNSQGIGLPLPSTSSAATVKGADMIGLDIVTTFKGSGRLRKPAGWTVTLRFAGPVQQGLQISLIGVVKGSCGRSSRIQLGYGDLVAFKNAFANCQAPSGDTSGGDSIGSAELLPGGTAIRWSIDGSTLKPGTRVSDWTAASTVFVLGVFDEVATDKTFTYGR